MRPIPDPVAEKEHELYINLVDYLLPLFSSVSSHDAKALSRSGYLYFRFLLSFDKFIDQSKESATGSDSVFQSLALAFEFYERSIRGLSGLFPTDQDSFWLHFQSLKQRYFELIVFEKRLSAVQSDIDESAFSALAAGKSCICHATVYGLSSLSKTDEYNGQLLKCLDNIHIALQYLDDIEDFKIDITNGQWTYAHARVRKYLQNQAIEAQSSEMLYKYLFVSGIASEFVRKALSHLEESIAIASSVSLADLENFLIKKKQFVEIFGAEIDSILEKTKTKIAKEKDLLPRNTTRESITEGIGYLKMNLGSDNCWADFLTSAGVGKAWITAYVGFQLAEFNFIPALLKVVQNELRSHAAGSFNETIMQDGDSTTFTIGFRNKMGEEISRQEYTQWFTFCDSDGGWVTYRDGHALATRLALENVDVSGWTSSKACVTAAAAYILSQCKQLTAEYKKTCRYLIRHCAPTSEWRSYWWTSSVYATAFSIMALSADPEFIDAARVPAKKLVEMQQEEGCWMNDAVNMSSPLYTALAVKALILHDAQDYERSIRKGAEWLVRNQVKDGSWLTNRVLQIPATHVQDPASVANWRMSSLGVNCLVDDHNRVFTTATVVNCLAHFNHLFKDVIDSGVQ